jgi:hypothetical protein
VSVNVPSYFWTAVGANWNVMYCVPPAGTVPLFQSAEKPAGIVIEDTVSVPVPLLYR